MSRILEGIFVLGCSLVGLSQSFTDSSAIRNATGFTVQLVTLTENRIETNVTRLTTNLCNAPVRMLPRCWRY